MKKLFSLVTLSAMLLSGLFAGCATKPISPSVPALVQSASRTAVAIDLIDNPQHRSEYEDVIFVLDQFIAGGDLDPATLRTLFRDASPKVLLAILAGVDLYDAYFADVVKKQLADREHLIPVLQSLRSGIQQGLDVTR